MYLIGKTPALVLGTTAIVAFGASGLPAAARTSPTSAKTTGHAGRGIDTAALAAQLGVSEAAIEDAIAAVRVELGTPDREADLRAEAEAIASALGVDVDTVTSVLESRLKGAAESRAQAQATADGDVTPTTPRATKARPDQAALIAALVDATGKTETQVKAALKAGRTARDSARAAQQARFTALLAAKLGISDAKVEAALTAIQPVRPSRPANTPVGATA